MALADIGVGTGDFEDNSLADFGTSVVLIKVNETADFRGNISETFTGTDTITAVFHTRSKTIQRTPEGVVELAPAFLMSKVSDDVGTGDKIIVGTGTGYRVFNVLNRRGIYKFSDLYFYEVD